MNLNPLINKQVCLAKRYFRGIQLFFKYWKSFYYVFFKDRVKKEFQLKPLDGINLF
jgi:hypothetical protein